MQPDSTGLEPSSLAGLISRPEWFARASCRSSGLTPYFPGKGGTATEARAVCAVCPVRGECLDYALPDPDLVGVWGGTSARERVQLRRVVA
jgi:WhiB family redox-sensing transcriptional regulator